MYGANINPNSIDRIFGRRRVTAQEVLETKPHHELQHNKLYEFGNKAIQKIESERDFFENQVKKALESLNAAEDIVVAMAETKFPQRIEENAMKAIAFCEKTKKRIQQVLGSKEGNEKEELDVAI